MESTAQILEKLDGAAFEQLCIPVLRNMVPALSGYLSSGLNNDGRTIKSLFDGFSFIHNKHFATVHVTTNASNLKAKWLYDGDAAKTPKGDLIKGIVQARQMHSTYPDYKFTIYLVSNRRVDERLHIEVNQTISDDFITVKIIEQRDLVDFLDFKAEGKYLKRHFWGIDADRISESLLKDITKANLSRYGKEIYLEEKYLANVSGINMVKQQLDASTNRINLIRADSGFGKSTICFAMMREAIESGVTTLRISPANIEKAVSCEDAILQQLISDYPKLYIGPKDIEAMFKIGLLVVDDINKSPNASVLLDKVISWNETKSAESFTVLCPVWPRNLAALDNKAKKLDKYTTISLVRLSFHDCRQIIERRMNCGGFPSLTDQQIRSLIFDTGFDPLLLDFSLQLLTGQGNYTDRIASDAISQFIGDKIQQAHHSTQAPIHIVNKSLILFGKEMLKNQMLNPHLQSIEKWLGKATDEYRLISTIGSQRQLFAFDDQGYCHFRHDRVLEHLLIMAATELLGNYDENVQVLMDPFYAEIIGGALAGRVINKDLLERLINANPLAVFSSLKYLQDHPDGSMLNITNDVCETWSSSIKRNNVPKEITDAIGNLLVSFDAKDIARITHEFPSSAEIELAKFRNGIWLSAIKFISLMSHFYPGTQNYWWNSILAHVKAKHLKSITAGLHSMLPQKFTGEAISHAYTFAGFLRQTQLLESLVASWKKYAAPENYVSYLWAILNSFTPVDKEIVSATLSYFNTLTNKQLYERSNLRRPLASIIQEIEHIGWDFSEEQLAALIELGSEPNLHEILALLLYNIDHPGALVIVLNEEMKRDEANLHDHRDDRWDVSKKWPKLSEASRNYLLEEFSNPANSKTRRYVAWRFWTGNVETDLVFNEMKKIVSEKDALYENAILWRIHHQDQTAFSALKEIIPQKPWLIRTLSDVWSDETAQYFIKWFKTQIASRNKESIEWGLELLEMLDNDFAVQMLIQHWEQIKRIPRAIGLALFLSVSQTVTLADNQIRRLGFEPGQPMPDFYYRSAHGLYSSQGDGLSEEKKMDLRLLSELFTRLEWNYGIKFAGKPERLTKHKLQTLLPYLELMDSFTLYQFAIRSRQIGATDLCYDKFYPLLGRHERRRIRLTTDDVKWELLTKLRELEREKKVYISHWIDEADRLGLSIEMLRESIHPFLEEHKTGNAFFIVALIFERLGTRKDIETMARFVPNSPEDIRGVEYWRANTVFMIKRRTLS